MSMLHRVTFLAVMFVSSTASAQSYKPVEVVRTLPGWQCMALVSAYGAQGTYAPPAPVFAGPDSNAQQVGTGTGVIIVPDPIRPTNGRTEMIWPNGRKVWIDVNQLTSWRSLSDPKAVCHPALLSNGRYGFTTAG